MKTHFYEHNPAAWEAHNSGAVDIKVATNQTACGYVREKVSRNSTDVDCKLCLKAMSQQN